MWADFGPDPVGNLILIFILTLSTAGGRPFPDPGNSFRTRDPGDPFPGPGASEGCRNGLLAKWFYGGLGYKGRKTAHVSVFVFGLAAFGSKAKQPCVSETCVFFGLGYPKPPKNHLAKKALRHPSEATLSESLSRTTLPGTWFRATLSRSLRTSPRALCVIR